MAVKTSAFQKFQTDDGSTIAFVFHKTFTETSGEREFLSAAMPEGAASKELSYMPDEVTKECARRMHYAAYRCRTETNPAKARVWKQRYFKLRNMIITGNQKLVYRAVQKCTALSNRSDDAIGDAFLVLINAVTAFNPWIGIRFSTYAFTCLMRGLHRMTQKHFKDCLIFSLTFDPNTHQESEESQAESSVDDEQKSILQYLQGDHPLLSDREKHILSRRFRLDAKPTSTTLKEIGNELGISKERVRQVQLSALSKLREELSGDVSLN